MCRGVGGGGEGRQVKKNKKLFNRFYQLSSLLIINAVDGGQQYITLWAGVWMGGGGVGWGGGCE